MWWLAIPALVGGAAWLIGSALESEAGEQRRKWAKTYVSVQRTVEQHRRNIEAHLASAQSEYDFHRLCDLHFSSMKVADQAYSLKRAGVESKSAVLRSIQKIKTEMQYKYLQSKLRTLASSDRSQIHTELAEMKQLKKTLFDDVSDLNQQISEFASEVQRFNHVTHSLKEAIRTCGPRGQLWYLQHLERRRLKAH